MVPLAGWLVRLKSFSWGGEVDIDPLSNGRRRANSEPRERTVYRNSNLGLQGDDRISGISLDGDSWN